MKKMMLSVAVATASVVISQNALAETWRMALGDAQGGTQYAMGQKFAELINEKTDGQVRVDLFPNGQLGDEQSTVNDAGMGLLDLSVLAINNITPFSPTVGVLTLPYVITGSEDAKVLTQGEIGEQLKENTIRDAGVRILSWAYSGCRVLSNSRKPVASPADLRGLTIRVPRNEIMIASYQEWGVNPLPMAWSETFTALQQGVVDGQDNPYITINAMRFYEVQDYITDICYVFSLEPLIMSESKFQSLSSDMQEIVLEAGREATAYSYDYLLDSEESIKQALVEEHGMQIIQPVDDEREWIERASSIWPRFYDSIGGEERLQEALSVLGRDLN
ncbi:TRAP transporter substrate-binding protein [Halomonas sp. BM-2019]|uniref:TRAP transporter substrate-binding protein n=1 Tax=Halomonas sp. BM-2019 TaxID=2811227 RepID=UPI0031FE0ED3